jgi:hypothetical protein
MSCLGIFKCKTNQKLKYSIELLRPLCGFLSNTLSDIGLVKEITNYHPKIKREKNNLHFV